MGKARFSVLSFNCAAVPFATSDIRERLALIGREVSRLGPTVACFQEVYFAADARALASALPSAPHVYWEPRLRIATEGGLVVASTQRLTSARFVPFRHQGPLLGLGVLSRLSHKGMMVARSSTLPLWVVSAHPLADFDFDIGAKKPRDSPFLRGQMQQMRELAALVESLDQSDVVVVAGDLNVPVDSAPYRWLVDRLDLFDPFAKSLASTVITGRYDRIVHRDVGPKRLDHVLIRQGRSARASVESARDVLTEAFRLRSGRQTALSDHSAVMVELDIETSA